MSLKRYIWVTLQKEGTHCYPEAGTRKDLEDVSFLAHVHRHIFHFKVALEVQHNNRDLEFIQVKRFIENLYNSDVLELSYKSCEMIGEELIQKLLERYGSRDLIVEISEDQENGCRLEWSKETAIQS